MTLYDDSLTQLLTAIANHPSIQAFKSIEKQMQEHPELQALAFEMKKNQQDAVLFKQIEKERAANQSGKLAETIEEELENHPLVEDYREKMQDASDLIQYITKTIEEKVNKEVGDVQS